MQYHNYIFLSSKIQNLPPNSFKKNRKEFLEIIDQSKEVVINGYATLGLKVGTNILLWFQSDSLESIQDLINQLMHTELGKNLEISYSLLGIARPTQYSPDSQNFHQTNRKGGKYLVIYPFTKTQDWYQLGFPVRKKLMVGHIDIGMKHPNVEQLLLYSFGLDDQEFIVSYETDDLLDFQSLVMDLRSDQVRNYTKSDTPIFTCIYKPLNEVLNYL
jgi:chlorite dismutase